MQWTTGDKSNGLGGFGGLPAMVVVNWGDGIHYDQIGLFDLNSSVYNGALADHNGVHWLSNQCFYFNTTNTGNLSPVSTTPPRGTVTIPCGTTKTINFSFTPPETNQFVTTTVGYVSSLNPSVTSTSGYLSNTTVSITGSLSNLGTNNITFTATDSYIPPASTQYTMIIDVKNVEPINGTPLLCINNTVSFTDITPGGVWSSSDNSIAIIDNNGNVSGIGSGSVIIYYTIAGCNSVSYPLTVNPLPTVSIIGSTATTLIQGQSLPLTGTPAGGFWKVDDAAFATVVAGVVTAVSPGSVVITYTYTDVNGCTNTAEYPLTVLSLCYSCTNTISNADFTNNTTLTYSQNTYCLDEDFNIPTGTVVNFQNSNVRIGKDVTITVADGATLNILGSHLYGCDDMWYGIKAAPGAVVNITDYTTNGTTLSSFIEDADIAVEMLDYRNAIYNNNMTGTGNNYLTANNTIFNRNKISIQIDGYSDITETNMNHIDRSDFYPFSIVNCLFTCRDINFTYGSLNWDNAYLIENIQSVFNNLDAQLTPSVMESPYINDILYPFDKGNNNAFLKGTGLKSSFGIVLKNIGFYDGDPKTGNYYGIKLGAGVEEINRHLPAFRNTNIFDNTDVGIQAENSNLYVRNCTFQKPYLKSGFQGIGINAINNTLNTPTWDGYYELKVDNQAYIGIGRYITYIVPPTAFFDNTIAINSQYYFKNEILNTDIRNKDHAAYRYIYPGGQNHSTTVNRGDKGINIETDRYDNWLLNNNNIYNVGAAIQIVLDPVNDDINQNPFTTSTIDIESNTIDVNLPNNTAVINPATNYVSDAILIGAQSFQNPSGIPNDYISCNNNFIYNVYNGITFSALGNKSVTATNNTVNLIEDLMGVHQYGITLLGGNAIYVSQNQGANVRCNDVHNLNKGICFNNVNLGASCLANTFTNDNLYGLYMDNSAIIGPQGTYDVTNSIYIPADNDWGSSTWTPFQQYKIVTANGTDPNQSKFYIRQGLSFSNYDPSNSSFLYNNSNFPYNIGNGLIVVNSTCSSEKVWCYGNDCDGNWRKASSNHFKYNRAIPELSDSILKKIVTAEKIATAAINIPAADSSAIMTVMQQQLYNSLLVDTVMLSNSSILQNFMQQGNSAGSHWFNALVGDLISKGDAQSAAFAINMWEPDNKADSNYYQYYNWLTTIKLGDTLSAQDTAGVYAMALSCPFTNGTVVYWARNLYNKLTCQHIIFSNNCNNYIEERKKKSNNKILVNNLKKEIKVFPNPTSGIINIQLPNSGKWQIQITDITGRTVWQQECNGCEGILKHNLGTGNGLYLIKITDSNTGHQSINKIILQ